MTDIETTFLQLQDILLQTRCNVSPFFRIVEDTRFDVDCDEVYPNLFIGNENAAKNKEYLKAIGITHIVNMADGHVHTGDDFYKDQGIKYMGIAINDSPVTKISLHFEPVSRFVADGMTGGGKVLVHCVMGYSRSASCVIAHLMISEKLSAIEACRIVKSKHVCRPNDGFLKQLADLDNILKCKNRL